MQRLLGLASQLGLVSSEELEDIGKRFRRTSKPAMDSRLSALFQRWQAETMRGPSDLNKRVCRLGLQLTKARRVRTLRMVASRASDLHAEATCASTRNLLIAIKELAEERADCREARIARHDCAYGQVELPNFSHEELLSMAEILLNNDVAHDISCLAHDLLGRRRAMELLDQPSELSQAVRDIFDGVGWSELRYLVQESVSKRIELLCRYFAVAGPEDLLKAAELKCQDNVFYQHMLVELVKGPLQLNVESSVGLALLDQYGALWRDLRNLCGRIGRPEAGQERLGACYAHMMALRADAQRSCERAPTMTVVGAGPVGLMHALMGAVSGYKVVVLEKRAASKVPRENVVGLSAAAWPVLRAVGVLDYLKLNYGIDIQSGLQNDYLEVTIGFLEEALKASLEAVLDANPIRYESTIDDAPKSDVTVIADGNRSATSRQLGIQRPNISQAIHGLALQLLEDEAGLSRRDKETLQGYMWSLKAGRHISMAVEIEEVDLRLYKQMCQHAGREGAASYLEDLAKQAMPVMETAHLVRVDPVDSVMRAALEVDMLRGKEWTWVVGDALATPCPTSGQGLVLPTEHLPMVYFTLLNARERDGRFPFIRALFQVMQRSLQVAQARAGFAMRELVELSGTQLIELLLVFGTGHDKGAKKVVRRRSIRDLRRIFKKDA